MAKWVSLRVVGFLQVPEHTLKLRFLVDFDSQRPDNNFGCHDRIWEIRPQTCPRAVLAAGSFFAFGHGLSMSCPLQLRRVMRLWVLEIGHFSGHSGTMATLPPLEPLVDAKAASAMLGIHRKTVLKLARQGLLRGARYARRWHFRRNDLVSWIERHFPSAPGSATTSTTIPESDRTL